MLKYQETSPGWEIPKLECYNILAHEFLQTEV